MARREPPSRRRFLQVTGATATMAFLAGCEGPGTDEADDDPELEEGTGNGQDRADDEDGEDEGEDDETEDGAADEDGDAGGY